MSGDPLLCMLNHGDQPTEPQPGLLVCRRHRNELDNLTVEISNLIVDLCRIRDGGAPSLPSPKTRHTKAAEAPAPGDLTIMALFDARTATGPVRASPDDPWDTSQPLAPVLHIIASWLLLVADERPLTTQLPGSVLGQLDLLARHHDWLAGQPCVGDYRLELRELRTHLRAAAHDHTHRRVATCDLPTVDGRAPMLVVHRNRAVRWVRICGGSVLCENGSSVWRCVRCQAEWLTDQQKARFAVRVA